MTWDGQVPEVVTAGGDSTTQGNAVTAWTCRAPPECMMCNPEYHAGATAEAIAGAGGTHAWPRHEH